MTHEPSRPVWPDHLPVDRLPDDATVFVVGHKDGDRGRTHLFERCQTFDTEKANYDSYPLGHPLPSRENICDVCLGNHLANDMGPDGPWQTLQDDDTDPTDLGLSPLLEDRDDGQPIPDGGTPRDITVWIEIPAPDGGTEILQVDTADLEVPQSEHGHFVLEDPVGVDFGDVPGAPHIRHGDPLSIPQDRVAGIQWPPDGDDDQDLATDGGQDVDVVDHTGPPGDHTTDADQPADRGQDDDGPTCDYGDCQRPAAEIYKVASPTGPLRMAACPDDAPDDASPTQKVNQ